MRIVSNSVVLGLALLGASSASAATSFVENFDENIGLSSGNFTTLGAGSTIGVFTAGAAGIEIQRNYPGLSPADSGTQLVELDTFANSSMFTMIDSGTYSLKFAYSARPGVAASSNGIDVYFGSTLLGSFAENGVGLSNTAFSTKTLDFTASTAGALRFVASGTSDSLGGFLDTISLTPSPAPEPASWALMLGGFGAIGGAMRSRRKAAVSFG
jgi:hypothetical protein